jgi:hypothetical protein
MEKQCERRAIPGWEGYYEASADGRIWSLARTVPLRREGWGPRKIKPREMRQSVCPLGYCYVALTRHNVTNGRRKSVHRLVMMAFEPRPDIDFLDVNHKDGNPSNNGLSNLEWCTRAENCIHAWRVLKREHGMKKMVGALNVNSVAVEAVDPTTGEVVKRYESMHRAELDGHVNQSICKVVNGKKKTHHGLIWRRA